MASQADDHVRVLAGVTGEQFGSPCSPEPHQVVTARDVRTAAVERERAVALQGDAIVAPKPAMSPCPRTSTCAAPHGTPTPNSRLSARPYPCT